MGNVKNLGEWEGLKRKINFTQSQPHPHVHDAGEVFRIVAVPSPQVSSGRHRQQLRRVSNSFSFTSCGIKFTKATSSRLAQVLQLEAFPAERAAGALPAPAALGDAAPAEAVPAAREPHGLREVQQGAGTAQLWGAQHLPKLDGSGHSPTGEERSGSSFVSPRARRARGERRDGRRCGAGRLCWDPGSGRARVRAVPTCTPAPTCTPPQCGGSPGSQNAGTSPALPHSVEGLG